MVDCVGHSVDIRPLDEDLTEAKLSAVHQGVQMTSLTIPAISTSLLFIWSESGS